MIRTRFLALATAALLAAPTLAAAQTTDPHANHTMPAADTAETPATTAFKAAGAAMHGAMAIPYTGNADVDFIAGMIPHHQGAVEAARIVLQYGTDPEVRKFAEQIIAAQEAEIAWMTDWLAKAAK